MYNIEDFSPKNFYALKSTKLLEEKYYEYLEIEHKIEEEMYENLQGPEKDYISDLIHEGRSSANTAISTIKNMDFYRKNYPEQAKAMEHQMYHYLLLFSVYIRSLVFFYNNWKGENS